MYKNRSIKHKLCISGSFYQTKKLLFLKNEKPEILKSNTQKEEEFVTPYFERNFLFLDLVSSSFKTYLPVFIYFKTTISPVFIFIYTYPPVIFFGECFNNDSILLKMVNWFADTIFLYFVS